MQSKLTRRYVITTALTASTGLSALVLSRSLSAGDTTSIRSKTFKGNRTVEGVKGDGGEGLLAQSNSLIQNCKFLDLGNGAVRVRAPIDNLRIENCEANNLYRFLEVTSSDKKVPADLTHFVVRQVTAREVDRTMTRIRYGSHSGTIEDVKAFGSSRCDLYCVGYQLDGTAHDITYTRVEAHDFREASRPKDKYWNGDGFSDERGNHGIRYISCVATGCSDGGFDLKSADVRLENCIARANKRNYRLWNSGELLRCTSVDPHHYGGTGGKSHFSFHGGVKRYIIDQPVVKASPGNSAPVFFFATKEPMHLEIRNATIDAPDAPLIRVEGPEPVITWVPERDAQKIRVKRNRA
ncbi:hypothetical protein [Novosphingobium mathurense]|uniref:Right handed beta helix region n=1 Tax=Novosphingobium mathurense TaxID=428990 RepID=A0A1U6IBS3_9SPHN|nr:hypothetical protein [Novosphingobium mathurense]SLK05439.1 hypothetical protein SAMN06295987_105156 [Novosphingobium mathurense]